MKAVYLGGTGDTVTDRCAVCWPLDLWHFLPGRLSGPLPGLEPSAHDQWSLEVAVFLPLSWPGLFLFQSQLSTDIPLPMANPEWGNQPKPSEEIGLF